MKNNFFYHRREDSWLPIVLSITIRCLVLLAIMVLSYRINRFHLTTWTKLYYNKDISVSRSLWLDMQSSVVFCGDDPMYSLMFSHFTQWQAVILGSRASSTTIHSNAFDNNWGFFVHFCYVLTKFALSCIMIQVAQQTQGLIAVNTDQKT